ncbi:MAG: nucleotidyltransferase family protein [Bryobacterales bacterium]|jgi:predicted nucleotidyltransferase|nr:nucleotidyltransferase family protein [Bryobacterales bacterium]
MLTLESLREHKDEILRVAEKHGARNVRVFGSVARGDAKESSDLDLLVEWEPGRSLFDHARLKLDLEEMLGRRVDIGTERSLSAYIRQQVLQEAAPL